MAEAERRDRKSGKIGFAEWNRIGAAYIVKGEYSASGGQVGQVVEEYLQFVGTRFSWLDVAETRKQSSTVTITTTEPHGFPDSEDVRVRVTGADNSHLNGSFEVTVTGDRTFAYKVSIFAPNTSGGNIQVALVTDEGSAWWQIDEYMWNHHPRTRGAERGRPGAAEARRTGQAHSPRRASGREGQRRP